MKKENIFLLVAIFVVLCGGIFFLKEGKKYIEQKRRIEMERLLNCLSEKEVELYVVSNCSYCDEQLAIFNEFSDKLKVVNCNISQNWNEKCEDRKINSFPLWLARADKDLKVSEVLISCDDCKKNNKGIYCEDLCYTKTDDGKYYKIIGILTKEKIKEIFNCQD